MKAATSNPVSRLIFKCLFHHNSYTHCSSFYDSSTPKPCSPTFLFSNLHTIVTDSFLPLLLLPHLVLIVAISMVGPLLFRLSILVHPTCVSPYLTAVILNFLFTSCTANRTYAMSQSRRMSNLSRLELEQARIRYVYFCTTCLI